MKITLLSLRQKKKDPFIPIQNEYLDKISAWKIENKEVLHKGKLDKDQGSDLLEKKITSGSYPILLDERGEELTSIEFSKELERRTVVGEREVTFIIGGAEGVTKSLKKKAKKVISFGRATWPHKMVRLMLIEQIYRAQQILRNHPYHKI